MKRILLAVTALCALAVSASLDEYHVKSSLDGTLIDWTSGDTYEEGLPSNFANAKVYLGVKALVDSTTFAGFSAIKYLSLMSRTGEVEITVEAGVTNVVTGAIADGTIRKKGAGGLSLTSPGGIYNTSGTINRDYYSSLYVEAGDLILPQNIGDRKQTYIYYLNVSEGATCVLTKNKETWISGDGRLLGRGTVAAPPGADAGSTRLLPQYKDSPACEIEALLTGGFRLYTCGNLYLSNTSSTMSGSPILYDGNASKCVSVPSIGMKGQPSPLGTATTISLQENGGYLRYVGDGETTDKEFSIYHSAASLGAVQSVIDGGPYGGLVLIGKLSASSGGRLNQRLELAGTNSEHPCEVRCPIPITTKNSDSQGGPYTNRLHIAKTGTGAWRMTHNGTRDGICGVTVKDGTLLFDVLAEVGETGSFGTGMVLGETSFCSNSCVIYNPANRVPYAFTLGSAEAGTTGTLALASCTGCVCTTRPMVISGVGRLLNDHENRMAVAGISPLPGVNSDVTLVLDGSSLAENVVADITNGVDASLSVVKQGTGLWRLSGRQTFSGDLVVKGGELVVENFSAGRAFNRFRVVFKENFGATNNCANVDGWAKNVIALKGLALYDAAGNDFNVCTNYNSDYTVLDEGDVAYADSARRSLLYFKSTSSGSVAAGSQPSTLAVGKREGMWCAGLTRPYLDKPETWIKLDFRVKEGSLVSAIDFQPRFGYSETGTTAAGGQRWNFGANPEIYAVYGSVDGMFWEPLFDGDVHTECAAFNAGQWYYGDGYSSGVAKGLAFSHTVSSRGGFDVLTNVRSLSVSGGAKFRTEGDPITLSSLALDASSGGTISNFTFAARGSFSVSNMPDDSCVTLPYVFQDVTGLENVAGWELAVPGRRACLYSVAVGDGAIRLVKRGFKMIIK